MGHRPKFDCSFYDGFPNTIYMIFFNQNPMKSYNMNTYPIYLYPFVGIGFDSASSWGWVGSRYLFKYLVINNNKDHIHIYIALICSFFFQKLFPYILTEMDPDS